MSLSAWSPQEINEFIILGAFESEEARRTRADATHVIALGKKSDEEERRCARHANRCIVCSESPGSLMPWCEQKGGKDGRRGYQSRCSGWKSQMRHMYVQECRSNQARSHLLPRFLSFFGFRICFVSFIDNLFNVSGVSCHLVIQCRCQCHIPAKLNLPQQTGCSASWLTTAQKQK